MRTVRSKPGGARKGPTSSPNLQAAPMYIIPAPQSNSLASLPFDYVLGRINAHGIRISPQTAVVCSSGGRPIARARHRRRSVPPTRSRHLRNSKCFAFMRSQCSFKEPATDSFHPALAILITAILARRLREPCRTASCCCCAPVHSARRTLLTDQRLQPAGRTHTRCAPSIRSSSACPLPSAASCVASAEAAGSRKRTRRQRRWKPPVSC